MSFVILLDWLHYLLYQGTQVSELKSQADQQSTQFYIQRFKEINVSALVSKFIRVSKFIIDGGRYLNTSFGGLFHHVSVSTTTNIWGGHQQISGWKPCSLADDLCMLCGLCIVFVFLFRYVVSEFYRVICLLIVLTDLGDQMIRIRCT